jgi:hypothetical protein
MLFVAPSELAAWLPLQSPDVLLKGTTEVADIAQTGGHGVT